MGKAILMTGFHFPPSSVSSGHLRLLAFTKYLPASGWNPVVLSASPWAYERTDPASVQSIPDGCPVYRALAFDAKRQLGIHGVYPAIFARPDRWASWWPAAVWRGLRLIKQHSVRAIWSTYPIMTAHCVAHTLHRLTGLPWIADFRDPVRVSVAGRHPMTARSLSRWEQRVVEHATCCVFTSPGAMQMCAEHHPEAQRSGRLTVIENGYDEMAFTDLPRPAPRVAGAPRALLHSGLLYPQGRDPAPFFTALARLKFSGKVNAHALQVILRASGSESVYAREISRLGIDDLVVLAPPVSHDEALAEQANADALLVFQGAMYDRQIPAKVYEYLRVGRPIFALTTMDGDTATVLRRAGVGRIAPIDDAVAIERELGRFVEFLSDANIVSGAQPGIERWSRRARTQELAHLLDSVAT